MKRYDPFKQLEKKLASPSLQRKLHPNSFFSKEGEDRSVLQAIQSLEYISLKAVTDSPADRLFNHQLDELMKKIDNTVNAAHSVK